jgi:predicted permease
MVATPFVASFLAGGVKSGLAFGLIVPFVMLIVEAIVLQPNSFADPNIAMAIILMMALPFGLISTGLGAAGSFAGRKVFKK